MLSKGHREAVDDLKAQLREQKDEASEGSKALEHARTNAKLLTKREQELNKKELALEYRWVSY